MNIHERQQYIQGAKDMRNAIAAKFSELMAMWKDMESKYDPRGQWEDREIAKAERIFYEHAIRIVRATLVEHVANQAQTTATAPDEPLTGPDVGVY